MAYVVKREVTENFLINVHDEIDRVLSNLDDIALILADTADNKLVLALEKNSLRGHF